MSSTEEGGTGGAAEREVSGESGRRGYDGEDESVRDEVIIPPCYEPGYFPAVEIGPASDVSISRSYNGLAQMYITQPGRNIISHRWRGTEASSTEWEVWTCFNIVPLPERVTSCNLANGFPAVFVSAFDGALWSRFSFPSWGPWLPLTPPPGKGKVVDLDAVAASGDSNRLYAARSGKIFVRYAESSDPYAALGPWRELGELMVESLSACRIGMGRDRVFVTTSDREVWSAIVDASKVDDTKWLKVEFGLASLVECVVDAEGKVAALVADPTGVLWSGWVPFDQWKLVADTNGPLKAIDVLRMEGAPPLIATVRSDGSVATVQHDSGFLENFR